MINIENKLMCTGCGACISACNKKAISMQLDEEGFMYPVVNRDECNQCGRCDMVCHMKKEMNLERNTEEYYAAFLKDKTELENVSSGGAAWAITQGFIRDGGVVYGAVQDGVDRVYHKRADNVDSAKAFCRSKYFQSDMNQCYADALRDIRNGINVLFIGVPCQIAGLYSYLGKKYDNLYTVDIVCHGVPSIVAFNNYRKMMEKKHRAKMSSIIFRDKSFGWSRNHYAIGYGNRVIEREFSGYHMFHGAYLKGLISRPACGDCRYAKLPRIADITLADFWKYNGCIKVNNEDKGISLIVLNTFKAKSLWRYLEEYMILDKVEPESAKESCRHLTKPPIENKKRKLFFYLMNKFGYGIAAFICMPDNLIKRILKK